jgi:NAD(P)H-hydrate epimerase
LIVDALIGYSLESAPHGPVAELIRWANNSWAPILALDLPSGIDATTGKTFGEFIRANWTMTLALPKTVLRTDKTDRLFLADIGIPEGVYRQMALPYTRPFGPDFVIPLVRTLADTRDDSNTEVTA